MTPEVTLTEDELRIVEWLRREMAGEVTQLMLMAGLPGGTRTQRTKNSAFAKGCGHAVTVLIDAIERGEHRQK